MRKLVLAVAALSCLAVPAQAMTVAEFLAKAKALQAKGLLAIGSPDIELLKREMKSVGEAYRADLQAAKDAGRAPHSCPPPKGQTRMTSKELMAELEAIPPAQQRSMSMKSAFYGIMKRRYPCR